MKKLKNFIVKHKKISIIFIILILIIVLICVFCFNRGNSSESEYTLEDKVMNRINSAVRAHVIINYDVNGVSPNVTTLRETTEGNWEVYGKVSARDTYNDTYTGTFQGSCEVKAEDDIVCDLTYSKMYKG